MAKRLVLALVLAAAALVVYNYISTGRIALIPTATLSAQDREINELEARVKQAVRQFGQAGRAAGLSGMDTTADAESARVEVQDIQRRLDELARKATGEAKEKVARVRHELEEARQAMGIH